VAGGIQDKEPKCVEPENYWCYSANGETIHENVVCCIGAEEFAWPDDTPKNTAVEMDASERACETIDGFRSAYSGNIGKHPVQDADLGDGGYDRCDHLNEEENPWRNFHVMAKLEISRELYALRRGDVSVCNENHICDWPAGEDSTTHKLADQIDAAVLVGDSHDNADWNEKDGADT
jgi:hypothetical protein